MNEAEKLDAKLFFAALNICTIIISLIVIFT